MLRLNGSIIIQLIFIFADLETEEESLLWDLCQILIDKGFLASHIAIENQELRKENASLLEKLEIISFDKEVKNSGKLAEKLLQAMEVQTDVDKTFSGFEFTLSKIEKMLSDRTKVEEKELKSGKKVGTEIEEINVKLSDRNVKNARKTTKEKVLFGNQINDEIIDLSEKPGKCSEEENKNLLKSITKKQEENLTQFIADEDNVDKLKHSKKTYVKISKKDFASKGRDGDLTRKRLSLNEIKALQEENDNALSTLMLDAKELSDVLNQYLNIDNEIKDMKAEIKRQKLNCELKEKVKSKRKSKVKEQIPQILSEMTREKASLISLITKSDEIVKDNETKLVPGARSTDQNEMVFWDENTRERSVVNTCMTSTAPSFSNSMLPFLQLCKNTPPHCINIYLNTKDPACSHGNNFNNDCNFQHPVLSKDVFEKMKKSIGVEGDQKKSFGIELLNGSKFEIHGSFSKAKWLTNEHCSGNESEQMRQKLTKNGVCFIDKNDPRNRDDLPKICKDEQLMNLLTFPMEISSSNKREQFTGVDSSMKNSQSFDNCSTYDIPATLVTSSADENGVDYLDTLINNLEDCDTVKTCHKLDACRNVEDHDDVSTRDCKIIDKFKNNLSDDSSISSDQELDLKIGSMINKSQNEGINKYQKNEKQKRHDEIVSKHICNSLEVQIISGIEGHCCYGDSFLSPLSQPTIPDDDVTEDDVPMTTTNGDDVNADMKSENVVVKKSWSLSNWFWGKKSKKKGNEEVATVCQ